MPIKFRCQHCQQFLGISRAKAGTITDCPTCGRTIRVPNLDGELEALPAPELNLDDSELVSALGKLASIGLSGDANSLDVAVAEHPHRDRPSTESPSSTPLKTATAPTTPAVRPEPIVLAPLAAAAPVIDIPLPASPPPVAPTTAESQHTLEPHPGRPTISSAGGQTVGVQSTGTLSSLDDLVPTPSESTHSAPASPLEQLAQQMPVHQTHGNPPSYSSVLRSRRTARNAAIISALICLPLGYLFGWKSASSSSRTTDGSGAVANEAAEPGGNGAAAPLANLQPAINGRLTYVSVSGDSHPDSAARVLVLPDSREGTAKLTVEPFRSGAAEGDLRIAIAAIRAAGGDFVVADQDGRFTISLPKAGGYQLLLMSHYQPRDERDLLEPGTMSLLEQYFDRPKQLIGATAYHLSRFSYRGDGVSPRDHTFDRLQ